MAAGVIIKDEAKKQHENEILRSFGVQQGQATAAQREAAEVIAARTSEVAGMQNGGKKYYGFY
ncbi:MAG: hypothetical protein KBS60_05265 [Phascolarctobacterium sp.]|nr:hypothetical protein [Candidatus Phascolarctobacterium caballi]